MARYFVGNRTALWGRNSSSVVWDTTLGSPARYNSTYVSGSISAPAPNTTLVTTFGVQLDLGLDGTTATNLYVSFDMLPTNANSVNSASSFPWVQFMDSSNIPILRVVNNGGLTNIVIVQYWNGSSWTSLSTFTGPPTTALSNWQFQIVTGASGTFRVWQDGCLVLELLSIPFNTTGAVKRVMIANHLNGTSYFSRIIMTDYDLLVTTPYMLSLPNVGAYNDGNGTIADMADGNLNTFKSMPANAQTYTAFNSNITIANGFTLTNVTMAGIMRATAPTANAVTVMELAGTLYTTGNLLPAPSVGFEWRGENWANYPTGGSWTANNFNGINKGHQART